MLTLERVLRALALPTRGRVYSLAIPVSREGMGKARGTMYNGFEGTAVRSDGAERLGIEETGPFVERGVQPAIDGRGIAVDVELLRNRGVYLFELCELDELARDRIYEFLFVAAPLPIDGGVAGPVSPVAVA